MRRAILGISVRQRCHNAGALPVGVNACVERFEAVSLLFFATWAQGCGFWLLAIRGPFEMPPE
jgi:hypothetical protein